MQWLMLLLKRFADAPVEEVQKLIKPAGFYRVKAGRIQEVSRILIDQYGGEVPNDMDELLTLPGVGRKTANCVFVFAFREAAIPVDTHGALQILKNRKIPNLF